MRMCNKTDRYLTAVGLRFRICQAVLAVQDETSADFFDMLQNAIQEECPGALTVISSGGQSMASPEQPPLSRLAKSLPSGHPLRRLRAQTSHCGRFSLGLLLENGYGSPPSGY